MRSRILFAGLGLALLITACDSADDDDVLNIGVVLPLSGTLSEAGKNMLEGMDLAKDEVNGAQLLGGTRLAFVVADNQSIVDESVSAVNVLIDHNLVPIILGPLTSSATSEIIPIAEAKEVVAFSPTSSATGLSARSSWLFRSSLTVERLVPTGIEVSKRHLGYQRVATIVNSGDAFSNSSNDKITEILQADADVAIVSAQSYVRPHGESIGDLTNELTDILNADPDAIFLSGLPEDQFGVITQAHALGITDTPYISTLFALFDVQKINEAVAGAAEGAVTFQVWLESSEAPLSKNFVNNYTARHGTAPEDFAARGYASVYILAEALASAESYEAASIRSALAAIRDLGTIYGSFSFDENGDAVYNPIVAHVQDNQFVILQ